MKARCPNAFGLDCMAGVEKLGKGFVGASITPSLEGTQLLIAFDVPLTRHRAMTELWRSAPLLKVA
jgi:hypothetical protein